MNVHARPTGSAFADDDLIGASFVRDLLRIGEAERAKPENHERELRGKYLRDVATRVAQAMLNEVYEANPGSVANVWNQIKVSNLAKSMFGMPQSNELDARLVKWVDVPNSGAAAADETPRRRLGPQAAWSSRTPSSPARRGRT